jgi:hypothetical protein
MHEERRNLKYAARNETLGKPGSCTPWLQYFTKARFLEPWKANLGPSAEAPSYPFVMRS